MAICLLQKLNQFCPCRLTRILSIGYFLFFLFLTFSWISISQVFPHFLWQGGHLLVTVELFVVCVHSVAVIFICINGLTSLQLYFVDLFCVYVWVHTEVDVRAAALVCGSQKTSWGFSFLCVGSRGQTQLVWLGKRCFTLSLRMGSINRFRKV